MACVTPPQKGFICFRNFMGSWSAQRAAEWRMNLIQVTGNHDPPAALQDALDCVKARDTNSNKVRRCWGHHLYQTPKQLHEMSQTRNTSHTTAYPIGDALRAPPVAGLTNELAGSLNTRKELHVGCWNVRTLLDPGTQGITIRSLYDYRVDIACLSEVRLPDSGTRRIKVPGKDAHYWLHHSGPNDNTGLHGVALALTQQANDALVSWTPISPRLAMARFKGKPMDLTVIAVYAPTLPSDDAIKDDFYEQLQATVARVPRRDILVIAGDWNARVGPNDPSTCHILGKFGIGQRCNNGDRLVRFADSNDLFVANTRFQHRKRHLLTWYSNDGRSANQIDFILVRSRWISSVADCRSYRGAEAGSDHTLVRARFQLRLTTRRKQRPSKRFNITLLDQPAKKQAMSSAIATQLTNQQAEYPETFDVNDQWVELKNAVRAAATTHLGTTTQRSKDWISANTIRLSSLAREARMNHSSDYRTLRRQATRSARDDRNKFWSDTASTMEAASSVGDFGKLYRLIRSVSGVNHPPTNLLRNNAGDLISDQRDKLQRWVDHFSELLNRPAPQSTIITIDTITPYEVNCEAPTKEEITAILDRLKNNKSPGEDGISPEIYRTCQDVLLEPLHKLLCNIWEKEVCPDDWRTSILLPLPKKGDKTKCENYRGISLIDVAAKVFATILLKRFSQERNARVRPSQGGFRPGRGCVDQIFTLRRILEHRNKYQQPTVACFIDFRAAFDSLDRESLWKIILSDGLPQKLLTLIEAYYTCTKARIRIYGEESNELPVSTGVRQGCPLSPAIFNYAVDWTMRKALDGYPGVQLSPDVHLTDLEYADDIVIFGDSASELQRLLNRIDEYASMLGLEINVAKTKLFSNNAIPNAPTVFIRGETIESVSSFKYLGSILLPTGQAFEETVNRINRARSAFLQLKKVLWNRREVTTKTKLRIYESAIRPVLLYGCETWPLRVEDVRKLESFDHWCIRRILRVSWFDKLSNDEVRRRFHNIRKLSSVIQRRRLQWLGHVLRKENTDLCKQALCALPCPGWRCRLGGQLKTWIHTIKTDVDSLGLHLVYGVRRWKKEWLDICIDLASDRRAWAAAIRDINGAD